MTVFKLYELFTHFSLYFLQIECRQQHFEENGVELMEADEFIRPKTNCTLFLGYTSNMVSAGLRETIRFLVEHKMVCLCQYLQHS